MFGILRRQKNQARGYGIWLEVVGVLYSYLVIIDYAYELEELHDIKRALKEIDKILAQLPHSTAAAALQEAINNYGDNQQRFPRLPEGLIRVYALENAESFWAAGTDEEFAGPGSTSC